MTLDVKKESEELSVMKANSEMNIKIGLPKFLPMGKRVFQAAGNAIITKSLDQVIKKFLESIEKDYQDWAMDSQER